MCMCARACVRARARVFIRTCVVFYLTISLRVWMCVIFFLMVAKSDDADCAQV